MLLIVSDNCDVHSLTAEELEYIPKIILLREFKNYIDRLWDRLPEYIKADSEVQQHRRCLKHYNLPCCGLLNHAINALPIELHIPGYQFCGPGTRLVKRLARGDRGINPLDEACREHDIAYSQCKDLAKRHVADNILAEEARKRITAKDSTLGERAAATAVWAAMKAKTKIGMGLKTKKKKSTKKRILPVAKRGGILPMLPLLGVVGSLVGGAAGVAKAINDSKAAQRQLEELKRHNRVMEGHGVYLAPYKRGRGISRKKIKKIGKKKRQTIAKNAKGCNYQRTTTTTGETYAYSIF
ncbi:hypothetical protein ALC62_03326 [Cyphomyrmex costatus]|uniref:Phospholipase A2-like domain-containing protein n=1 Tax=Cyphomyrmex costatus TaxID=456900 RepID=A0A151ILG9_9HYME|nr:hypothetical protein ALC62_03326 [Cyphomyrmex costatus]